MKTNSRQPIIACWALITLSAFNPGFSYAKSEEIFRFQDSSYTYPIDGYIKDSKGVALANVTVKIAGTNKGTITDKNGYFRLISKIAHTKIIISAVGFENKEMEVSNAGTLNIVLQLAIQEIKEVNVVSTGYQTISQERATGAFTKIGNEKFNEQVGINPLDRLSAIANGFSQDRRTTNAGFMIRGLSTIQGPKGPLIVVDNFPYEGDITNINPAEIESITLLKDAAAASIWGTRAGNGVLVITTKKGSYNKPLSIQFNSNITIGDKPDLSYIKQISSSDAVDVESFLFSKNYKLSDTSNINRPPITPVYEILIKQKNGLITPDQATAQLNALRGSDIRNDFNRYLYKKSVIQQYGVNVTGGSLKNAWVFFAGFDNSNDELKNIYQKINLKLNNTFKPFNNFQVYTGIYITESNTKVGRPGYGSIATINGAIPVYTRLADNNGNPVAVMKDFRQSYIDGFGNGKLLDWNYYPLTDYQNIDNKTKLQDLLGNLNLEYKFFDDFKFSVQSQFERQQVNNSILNGTGSYFTRNLINRYSQLNGTDLTYVIPKGAIYDLATTTLNSYNLRGQLDYTKSWGDHYIVAIAGAEIKEAKTTGNTFRTYGYDDNVLTHGNVDYTSIYPFLIGTGSDFIPDISGFTSITNRFVSTYLNGAYTYKNKYTVSISGRRDASNLFGVNSNDKWTPLWSTGLSWDISKENGYNFGAIPYLKLRATYGVSGNVDQSRSAVSIFNFLTNSPYTLSPYARIEKYANPDLRWEKSAQFNIGIDFSTAGSRITGSLDYYRKKGSDLFGPKLIDYTGGAGYSIVTNAAKMVGTGIDFQLTSLNTKGIVKWTTDFIFNYSTDKITEYYLPKQPGATFIGISPGITGLVGKPVYSVFSYKWAGLDPTNGDPQGIVNGKVSKDYSTITGAETTVDDLKYNGPVFPKVFGSLGNTFTWKNISLTARLTYKFGYYFRKSSINYTNLFTGRIGHSDFAQRWQKPGDENHTFVPSMTYPLDRNRDLFYSGSDILVDKGDHIRLQYITLAYALPEKNLQNSAIRGLQIFFNTNNVGIIWRANKDKIDPDYPIGVLPAPRNYSLGVKANF
jgi:TonB-linked SusC/RagA family outer membrane protein